MLFRIITIQTAIHFLSHHCSTMSVVDRLADNLNQLVMDMSKDCEEGYFTSVRLSFGFGSTDARVLLIRSLGEERNCSVLVTTSGRKNECGNRECFVVVVTEFYNYNPNATFCETPTNSSIKEGMHEVKDDICRDGDTPKKYQLHRYLMHKNKFVISMTFSNFTGTIKVTVTAARYLGSYGQCNLDEELRCIIHSKKICISNRLACDGNHNCGILNYFDEYCLEYASRENVLYAVIYCLCLMAIMILFFIQILRVCIPAVAEHFFIFNEGEENKFVLKSQSLPPLELENEIHNP